MPFLAPFVAAAGAVGAAVGVADKLGAFDSDEEEDMHDELVDAGKKSAQLDALNYNPYEFDEGAYKYGAGSEWGDQQQQMAMNQQLADTGQLNEARRQQMMGRGQQQQGLGLLGDSARGGGGNEMLRAFAAGEGDVAGALHGRAMGEGLIAEKVAAAQRDKLGAQIATQAASGRGGYDPASRRAAINAMSGLGQQGAAGTAALGAQEAAMAGQLYQGNRLAGAGAYQKGMLGAQSAYAGALQGMRGQDIGVQGLEQRDVARQQAGTLGKMNVGMTGQALGMQDKEAGQRSQQRLQENKAKERQDAMNIRTGQQRDEMKQEQMDDEQDRKTATGIMKGVSDSVAAVGSFFPKSDEDAKKNVDQASMNEFLKSLGEAKGEATKDETMSFGDRLKRKLPELERLGGRVDRKLRGAGNALKHDDASMSGTEGPPTGINLQRRKLVDRGDPNTSAMDDAVKAISMGQPMTPEMKLAMFPPVPDQGQPQPGPQTQPLPPAGAPPMMSVNAQDPASYAQPRPGPSDSPWEEQMLTSDERAKTAMTDAPMEDFMDPLKAQTWEYKDKEADGYGRHTGPMAQSLQKSAVGKEMVMMGPDGDLRVNYDPKRVGPIMLSALGHLNDRIEKLEG